MNAERYGRQQAMFDGHLIGKLRDAAVAFILTDDSDMEAVKNLALVGVRAFWLLLVEPPGKPVGLRYFRKRGLGETLGEVG